MDQHLPVHRDPQGQLPSTSPSACSTTPAMNSTIKNDENPMKQDFGAKVPHSKPLQEFTLFPKLAVELRLKIWKYALPIGPDGQRLLQLAAAQIVTNTTAATALQIKPSFLDPAKSTNTASSYLTFRLLDHNHNVYIKNLALLSTCIESRSVYLRYFTQSVRVGQEGLIRFAKDDIVFIPNIDSILFPHEFGFEIRGGKKAFEGLQFQKLALPARYYKPLWHVTWLPATKTPLPPSTQNGGQVLEFLMLCKELREIGVVADACEYARIWAAQQVLSRKAFYVWLKMQRRSLQESVGARDMIRRKWEECEELQGQKLPELCVWDMNANKKSF